MDRGTLIRSYTAGDLGFILHSRHQYHWHTGYAPPQTVAAPHIGAVDRPHARPARTGRAGVHQHRAALRSRRRRGAEGVHDRGVPRQRVWAVQHPIPRGRGRQRAAPRRHDAGPLRGSRPLLQASCSRRARSASTGARTSGSRCCARWTTRTGSSARPPPTAFDLSLEPLEHVRKYVPEYQPGQRFAPRRIASAPATRSRWWDASASAACSRGGSRKPARGSSR